MNSSGLVRNDLHVGKMGQSLDLFPFEKNSLWKLLQREEKATGSRFKRR